MTKDEQLRLVTAAWAEWLAKYRALGDECVPELVHALEHGDVGQQYAALIGLRMRGFEAWGQSYGHALVYELRAPGATDVRVIQPSITEPADAPMPRRG